MTKRFFISHSGAEKPLALEIKSLLDDDAWIDLHEIDAGQILLTEISAGIEEATDFVLLWSRASAASKWVGFELHMALIRWLEDNAVALRVICLDNTDLPLMLRPFLQIRGKHTAVEIAEALTGAPPATVPRRRFLNRNVEIGKIEDALYAPQTAALWLCGVPGVGKRSLARETVQRITAGSGALQRIKITSGVAESELNLLVASAMAEPAADENLPIDEVIAHTKNLLLRFHRSGGIWVFEDAEHWLTDDGAPSRILEDVFSAFGAGRDQTSHLSVFTSRRRPQLSENWADQVQSTFIQGLARNHAIPLLRAYSAVGSDEELAQVAADLDGHPLALEVVAPRLPLTAVDLRAHRAEIATDLIDPAAIHDRAWRLLEVLSLVDGPLSGEDIAEFMGLDGATFRDCVDEASAYSLVEFSSQGSLSLHPLVRDYFLRSYRKHPDHSNGTADLARISLRRFNALDPGDSGYVECLLATVRVLGLAGDFEAARSLRAGLFGTLRQTALELYQEKRYDEALKYIEEAISGNDEIDFEALRLKTKTLAYLGRYDEARRLGDQLISHNPRSSAVLRDRGRVEFTDRRWSAAITYYERAIALRRNPRQLWVDIAQARARMNDWPAAAAAAKIAIDSGADTPFALSLYSEALEQQGEYSDAEEVMARAVRREPHNPSYRHRLGRIAHLSGNPDLAVSQFRAAVEIDPNFVPAWVSLASLLADLRDIVGARHALLSAEARPGAPLDVIDNVKAKIAMFSGDLALAQSTIDTALRRRRDPWNLTLAVRILIARGMAGEMSIGQAQAGVRALAKELDSLGQLRNLLEYSTQYPDYF